MAKATAKTTPKKTTAPAVMHREFRGEVVSAPKQKTIHVLVKSIKEHAKYRKQYTVTKKFAVHDEKNEAAVGNTVRFEECRPLSKTKRWRLIQVVK